MSRLKKDGEFESRVKVQHSLAQKLDALFDELVIKRSVLWVVHLGHGQDGSVVRFWISLTSKFRHAPTCKDVK